LEITAMPRLVLVRIFSILAATALVVAVQLPVWQKAAEIIA
jgi:hypothetical protein